LIVQNAIKLNYVVDFDLFICVHASIKYKFFFIDTQLPKGLHYPLRRQVFCTIRVFRSNIKRHMHVLLYLIGMYTLHYITKYIT
jgi:hypothetical protein